MTTSFLPAASSSQTEFSLSCSSSTKHQTNLLETKLRVSIQENKRFSNPNTEQQVKSARINTIPKKTRDDTASCVQLWMNWAENSLQTTGVLVTTLPELDNERQQYCMVNILRCGSAHKEWQWVHSQHFAPE